MKDRAMTMEQAIRFALNQFFKLRLNSKAL